MKTRQKGANNSNKQNLKIIKRNIEDLQKMNKIYIIKKKQATQKQRIKKKNLYKRGKKLG